MFKLVSDFKPSGDQPAAIKQLIEGARNGVHNQTLLGVTGSGKTFTMANIIQELQMPALIMAPNKILSAQLYEEFKQFFPENAVEYFVSYYDYFRPEAYIPQKGLYIEKESSINEVIDQLRHKATRSLIERKDTIIVASVSCIYGIGSYESYRDAAFYLAVGAKISCAELTKKFIELSYSLSSEIARGKFRINGQTLWIGPSHIQDKVWRVKIENNVVVAIAELDPLTRDNVMQRSDITIFPNSHHIMPEQSLSFAMAAIKNELKEHLPKLRASGKLAEAQRLEERTMYDLEQLRVNHSCAGIENYSRFFTNRSSGQHPPNLYEYFPRPFLLFVDESHIGLPQLHGMSSGDAARKKVLVDYGFRLPSCADNRPMHFEEWDAIRPTTIFVSATPGAYELENSQVVQQLIRPTGLLDPLCVVKPTHDQVNDAIAAARTIIERGDKALMLTLTKKTAEHLTEHLLSKGLKVAYLHGEQSTLERIQKLYDFRNGVIDIIIGINLLREGIDLPECALICIFEADQEGFLRTGSALIQMIGRAARHDLGMVILYADRMTRSMEFALLETSRRRSVQEQFNKDNSIVPKRIIKPLSSAFAPFLKAKAGVFDASELLSLKEKERIKLIKKLEKDLKFCITTMNFEEAAKIRDKRNALMSLELIG